MRKAQIGLALYELLGGVDESSGRTKILRNRSRYYTANEAGDAMREEGEFWTANCTFISSVS